MAGDEEIKGKVIQFLAGAEKVRARKKANGAPRIEGNNNIQAFAGRDVNINTRKIERTTVAAPAGSVTPQEAKRIRDQIARLVRIEATAGVLGGNTSKLYAKWHGFLKNHFAVPSYRLIRSEQADEAVAFLSQIAAMNRPKLRRTDNESWRNEHYKGIWARSAELGMSKADVYSLAHQRLGTQVMSLKQLGEQNLQRLYEIIFAM